MSDYEVWFAIPTANPELCRQTLPAWQERGYRIALLQNYERGHVPQADLSVWFDHYPGWGESINLLCRDIVPASADIVVSGGDDMLPDPDRDAQQLAREYFQRFPDGFGVMQPAGDDFMWSKNYCGSPWFGRRFFETMYGRRGPMWGGYRHNWADYELYWVARGLGRLWMRDDARQFHQHFSRDGREQPEYWVKNVSEADRRDCEEFLARKYTGFPGHAPAGQDGLPVYDPAELLIHEQRIAEWRWNRDYSPHGQNTRANELMRTALERLRSRGARRVAVYGAGDHTQRCARALAEPPVRVVAIIDDAATRGQKLWGYPVLPRDEAQSWGIDAVVLSSDSAEERLFNAARPLHDAGVEIIRLYGTQQRDERASSPALETA